MAGIKGCYAVVTGGTRGIGRSITERLLREGAAVAFCGRDERTVAQAVSEMKSLGRVVGHAADVTDLGQVQSFFRDVERDFGVLDILVNNAGAGVFRKVADLTPEEWRGCVALNLDAPFYCAHEALPLLLKGGGGDIINISSLAGKNPFSGGAAYNAAKFGLNGFSEALMLDHRQDNVRVSYIMPGSVDTGFSGGPADRGGDKTWMISPDDVAEVVAMVLKMPARTMVSRVEMRPSRPRK